MDPLTDSLPQVAPRASAYGSLPDVRRPRRDPQEFAPFREIVACLDGSDLSRGVLPHARAFAAAFGGKLTLLRVLECEAEGSEAPADCVEWSVRRREARAYLDALTGDDGDSEVDLIQGRPAEQICHWADQHSVDLTVICSHGARGRTSWTLASNARKLIDEIPGSLLLVPAEAAAAAGPEVEYRRILVPLDGSPRAEAVVPMAVRIAKAHSAELLLAHIIPPPELTEVGPLSADDRELTGRITARNERVANEYLDRLRARVGRAGVNVRALVARDGVVRRQLMRAIEREAADLVVMSAHGQAGHTDAPCGSVAAHLLTHVRIPTLLYRERSGPSLRRVRSKNFPTDKGRLPGQADR